MFGFLKKKDKDELVIRALTNNGSDITKPHDIDFNFDFSSLEQAASIARAIDAEGYIVKMYENDDGTLTIEAKKSVVPSVENMQAITRRFEELTEKYGGHYDGWGTEIVE